MSLYIGKLSHQTCRDDLERAFTRFGRCEVRIKDGFGFVVYDFPPNAEKALRAFQGRTICGERLTISWSKKQPRGFPRFAGGDRTYGAQRGRIFARGGGYGRREHEMRMNMNRVDNDGRGVASAAMFQEKDNDYYNREERHDYRESLPDEGGVERAHVDWGRWGDQVRDISKDHKFENELESERCETYRGNERQNDNGNSLRAGRSPSPRSPREKVEGVQVGERIQGHSNDSKVKARCYNCGVIGHKKLNCPRGFSSYRKIARFDHGHNSEMMKEDRGGGNLERHESSPRGEVQLGKDTSMTYLRKDREVSGLRKHEMLLNSGSSPMRKKNNTSQRKDYKGKKRNGNEIRNSKERISKRARRSVSSVSSPLQSEYGASRSQSISHLSKSQQRNSRSGSRSASNRARSLCSSSRSYCSGSTSPKSRPRHSSHTSLSASDGQSLPSPPNGIHSSGKGSLSNGTTESGKISVKPGHLGEVGLGSHGANVNDTVVPMNDEKALSTFNMEDGIGKKQSLEQMSGSPFEMTNPCTPHLDKGVISIGSSPSPSHEETREFSASGTLVKEHMLTPFEKPDSEAPLSSCTGNLTSISAEELNKVLKHYGLGHPEQNERDVSAEEYFGSSRLWPWEIIYYRRLKKGPISTENYARRLAQNEEFGIVDKYVRGSSGWGELSKDSTV